MVSDTLQITLDALHIALDRLQIRQCVLQAWSHWRSRRFVLRAVRNDGPGREVGALIGIPDGRLLHEADGRREVGLARQKIADRMRLRRHVFVTGNRHAILFQHGEEHPVGEVNRWRLGLRRRRFTLRNRWRRSGFRRLGRGLAVPAEKHG